MSSRAQVYLLAFVFISTGLDLTLYKNLALHFPLSPGSLTRVWDIEAKITFWTAQQVITVDLARPQSQDNYQVLDETFPSTGYGFDIRNVAQQRRAIWTHQEEDGLQTLYYKLKIVPEGANPAPSQPPEASQIPDKFIWTPAQEATTATLITQARAISADPGSFATQLLRLLNRLLKFAESSQIQGKTKRKSGVYRCK